MSILSKLTSKDPHEIWAASSDIAKCTDIDELKALSNHLETIKKSTHGIHLGALCPNSYHLEFALKKLEHVRCNAGCLCSLYPYSMFYGPVKEQGGGSITIDATVEVDGKCNSRYKVEEREVHFTWWTWQKA